MLQSGKRKRASDKAGMPPGSLVHVGDVREEPVRAMLVEYGPEYLDEREIDPSEPIEPPEGISGVRWIDVVGLADPGFIERIGRAYGIHPLALEDILNTEHRPKLDDFEDYLFLILKGVSYDREERTLHSEQLAIVLGQGFVLTFRDRPWGPFAPVKDRLRRGKGRIRCMGADYLAYALMDVVVDHYFVVLEQLGEEIEDLEAGILDNPSGDTVQAIHALKRGLIALRKSVWPFREVVGGLERGEFDPISEKTVLFLRDLYDHTIQVVDTVETYRDMASGLLDIYLSSISNRMNEIMKLLTIIATLFIPLTFLAGVYGMNFKFMPELEWRWGYPAALLAMVLVALFMLLWFRRKRLL